MTSALVQKKQQTIALAEQVAGSQAATLAMHGLDPDTFKGVLVEALVANPMVLKADQSGLARALRQVCQDGVLPNGRDAALIINKDGSVRYQIMRDGIAKMLHRAMPGAEIRSGYVREGDDVQIVTDTDEGDRVVVKKSFAAHDPDAQIIGSWCVISAPGRKAFAHFFFQDDIRKAKAASNVKSGGPWAQWPGRMAEKAVVKSAVRKAMYMFSIDERQHQALTQSLDADDREELDDVVVIDETKPEPEVKQIEEETKPKARRKNTATAKRASGTKKKAEAPAPEKTGTAEKAEPVAEVSQDPVSDDFGEGVDEPDADIPIHAEEEDFEWPEDF